MLEFAGVMNDVDPASILTYQIEATDRNVNGAAVLDPEHRRREHAGDPRHVPRRDVARRRPHAGVRRDDDGGATRFDDDGRRRRCRRSAANASATVDVRRDDSTAVPPTDEAAVDELVPADGPQENQVGIVPPRDVTC